MATTGAVLYIKPRAVISVAAGRSTGAALHIAVRFLSGVYSAVGVNASADLNGLKSLIPHISVKVTDANGYMVPVWYRAFRFLADIQIGGPDAPTLPDVASTVETAQTQAATAAATVVGVQQQVTQNAEALSTVREVAVNNSLTGASQIPPVQRYPMLEP